LCSKKIGNKKKEGSPLQSQKIEILVGIHSCVVRYLAWGMQLDNFGLEALLLFNFVNKKAKTLVYLVLTSLGLGVQMPHCTPSGYATGHTYCQTFYVKHI